MSRRFPPPRTIEEYEAGAAHSPSTPRVCSSRSSSAMLLSERRTSSANGACGRQLRHDSDGIRLVSADQGWRSRVRRSMACVVWQAGQRTHRNQCRALSAQPIVGENSIGMRLACRSFHAATRRLASLRICASVAGRAAAAFSAASARRAPILRLLKPMPECENAHGAASISRAIGEDWRAGVPDIAPVIIGVVAQEANRGVECRPQ